MRTIPAGTPALLVRRLSRSTEASSSLERQAEDLAKAVAERGLVVVGDVEDPDVSGAVDPAQRPKLGPWMRSPLWESWSVIMVTALDRLTRDQHAWDAFCMRCHQGGKEIIVLTDPSLDIHTPTGRMMAYIRATIAQEEREKVSERRLNTRAFYRREDLWPGGSWPFGYRAEPFIRGGKTRFRLVPDPVTAPLVREAYLRVAEQGWSMRQLAQDWNARNIPTSRDHQRIASGQEPQGHTWAPSALRKSLRSPALKGVATRNRKPLLKDGLPVRWAEPLLTDDEFERLQHALDVLAVRFPGGNARSQVSPLNGLLWCGAGHRIHEANRHRQLVDGSTREHRYLRCATFATGQECPFKASWPREGTLDMVEKAFMLKLGEEEVKERRYIPGSDNRARIAELEAAIGNLAQAVAEAQSPAVVAALTRTMDAHAATLAKLREEPVTPPRWEEVGTGRTFAQWWAEAGTWAVRGPFLRQAGFRIFLLGHPEGYHEAIVITPADLLDTARDAASGTVTPRDDDADSLRALRRVLEAGPPHSH